MGILDETSKKSMLNFRSAVLKDYVDVVGNDIVTDSPFDADPFNTQRANALHLTKENIDSILLADIQVDIQAEKLSRLSVVEAEIPSNKDAEAVAKLWPKGEVVLPGELTKEDIETLKKCWKISDETEAMKSDERTI